MNTNWYSTLTKPGFTPPSEIFTPVWIILYALIILSVTIFIKEETDCPKTLGCIFFIIQLILNLSWTPIFFILHKINLALIIACLMLLFTLLTAIAFYKISKLSALLLIPYILWISFAIYLNYGFMTLN